MLLSQAPLFLTSICGALANVPDGVVKFQLEKQGLSHAISKRSDDTTSVQLTAQRLMFTTVLSIGSNEQNVTVKVATESGDTWIMAGDNQYCNVHWSKDDPKYDYNDLDGFGGFDGTWGGYDGNDPEIPGMPGEDDSRYYSFKGPRDIHCNETKTQFFANESETFHANSSAITFNISYDDWTYANGVYAQDTIRLGNMTIENANFAYVQDTDARMSVLGIGPLFSEENVYYDNYTNLPQQMVQQGLIAKNTYSMWLDYNNTDQGELLFGGVDHSKYSGALQTLPMDEEGGWCEEGASMIFNGVSLYQGAQSFPLAETDSSACLQSGRLVSLLEDDLVYGIVESIGGEYTLQDEVLVACDIEGGLTFNFGGIEINVPFESLLFGIPGSNSTCLLALAASQGGTYLGDSFLTSAYVVYDFDNKEIALAQAASEPGTPEIEAITSEIPRAVKASGYSMTVDSPYADNYTEVSFFSNTANISTEPDFSSWIYSGVTPLPVWPTMRGIADNEIVGSATSLVTSSSTQGASANSATAVSAMSTTSSSHTILSSSSSSTSRNNGHFVAVDVFSYVFTSVLGLLLYL